MSDPKDNFSDSVSNFELLERAKSEFNRERKLVIKNLPGQISEEVCFVVDFFYVKTLLAAVPLSRVVRSVLRNDEYNSDIANICYNDKQQQWHQLVRNLEQ